MPEDKKKYSFPVSCRFVWIYCRLLDEVESLEAILMDDVKITKNAET